MGPLVDPVGCTCLCLPQGSSKIKSAWQRVNMREFARMTIAASGFGGVAFGENVDYVTAQEVIRK